MVKTIEKNDSNIKRIVIGSGISIGITIIGLIIFSLLLTYTNVSESTIPTVTIIIVGVSILIGSTITTINVKKNGIINGAIVGLIYILIIYLLSSIIEKEFSLNIYSIIMIASSIIAGAIGGIIGVNTGIKYS